MAAELAPLVSRLEKVAERLENAANRGGGGGGEASGGELKKSHLIPRTQRNVIFCFSRSGSKGVLGCL